MLLQRRRAGAAAENDVPPVPERPLWPRQVEVEARDQQRAGARIPHGVDDRVVIANSGSPGKYIWVTSRSVNARPKTEKWMCDGRHAFSWLPHGYAPGLTVTNS